jgi:hypothetical protein
MPIYRAIVETEIVASITHSGFIAIDGEDHTLGKNARLLLSARQAQMLLEDLPTLIEMASEQQAGYIEHASNGGDDA